jgi:hypothetical protein
MHVEGTTPRERLLAALHTLAGFAVDDTLTLGGWKHSLVSLMRAELHARQSSIRIHHALRRDASEMMAAGGTHYQDENKVRLYHDSRLSVYERHGVDPSDHHAVLQLEETMPQTAAEAEGQRAALAVPLPVLDEARAALNAGGAVGLDAEGHNATTIGADLIAYRRLVDDFARGLTEPRLPPPDMPERIREVAARLRRAADLLRCVCNSETIRRPDFHLTTDLRATSDPLWQHLAVFRRRLMAGGLQSPSEMQRLLLDIRLNAHAALLRPSIGKVEYVAATVSEFRDADGGCGSDDEEETWSKVYLTACGEHGWIELHDLADGFSSTHMRERAIDWAESWMNARERQLAAPTALTQDTAALADHRAIVADEGVATASKRNAQTRDLTESLAPPTFEFVTAAESVLPDDLIHVAEAATQLNRRSDVLLKSLRTSGYQIYGTKRHYQARFEDVVRVLPRNERRQLEDWWNRRAQ